MTNEESVVVPRRAAARMKFLVAAAAAVVAVVAAGIARAAPAARPATGLSYWKVMRGELKTAIRLDRRATPAGDLWEGRCEGPVERAGTASVGAAVLRLFGRKEDLAYVSLEVDLCDVDRFGRKLAAYFDPPVRRAVRSDLGGAHPRTVTVRAPRPAAFRSGADSDGADRAIDRNVALLAELVRQALRDLLPRRFRVEMRGGVLVDDPCLDWLCDRLADAVLDGPQRFARAGRIIEIEVDVATHTAVLRIFARGLREAIGEEIEASLRAPAVSPRAAAPARTSRVPAARLQRLLRESRE